MYITDADDVCDLQRWIQKLEAIFESSPQCMLQIVFLVLADEGTNAVIIASLFLSTISVAQRFTNDDNIFFEEGNGKSLNFRLSKLKKCEMFISIPYNKIKIKKNFIILFL